MELTCKCLDYLHLYDLKISHTSNILLFLNHNVINNNKKIHTELLLFFTGNVL